MPPISKKNHIPRPKNSFMVYRQEKQYEALNHIKGTNNKDISKIVGKWWNMEPESVKETYRKKAEEAKREHARLYPNYKYCPKKNHKSQLAIPMLASNVPNEFNQDYWDPFQASLQMNYLPVSDYSNMTCSCCVIIQEPYYNDMKLTYDTPASQSPESVTSSTFLPSQDRYNGWNMDPLQSLMEWRPAYPTSQYDLPSVENGINPNFFYH